MTTEKSKRINARVSDETYLGLKYLCKVGHISITKFVEKCVETAMKNQVLNDSNEYKKWRKFKDEFEKCQKN